jgi:hypothetical protein
VLGQLTATQHLVTNHRVEPTEQGARCHSQVQATHVGTVADGGARWTGSGSYEIDLRRDERGWRITGYVFSASWNAGNRGLMTSAFQHRKGSNQSTSPIANGHRERR